MVEEANAIGTAWYRVDELPHDRQPEVRDLFRQYLGRTPRRIEAIPLLAELNRGAAVERIVQAIVGSDSFLRRLYSWGVKKQKTKEPKNQRPRNQGTKDQGTKDQKPKAKNGERT